MAQATAVTITNPSSRSPEAARETERKGQPSIRPKHQAPQAGIPLPPRIIDPATLPDTYAMVCAGDCMSPIIPDEVVVCFTKLEVPKTGDYVVIWRRPELVPAGQHQGLVKRLGMNLPHWVKFPIGITPSPMCSRC